MVRNIPFFHFYKFLKNYSDVFLNIYGGNKQGFYVYMSFLGLPEWYCTIFMAEELIISSPTLSDAEVTRSNMIIPYFFLYLEVCFIVPFCVHVGVGVLYFFLITKTQAQLDFRHDHILT